MATDQWEIRLVRPEDNVVLAHVLREVLIEMKVPFDGTALSDPELDAMYDAYQYSKRRLLGGVLSKSHFGRCWHCPIAQWS